MTREELQSAARHLEEASEQASPEARERLADQSAQFERHATADRGPDHGRLARHESILAEIAEAEGGSVADHVESALAEIRAYRETIEGV